MTTVLLPVTNIELPSDEWEMRNFKENKSFSEETMCFRGTLVHLPTGVKAEISNDGNGGADLVMWDQRQKNLAEAQTAWAQFQQDCLPALRASVANEPQEWLRTLYDNGASEESVIAIFTMELSNQNMLSRKRGTVVRQNAEDVEYRVYKFPAEQLVGRVQGQYWNKTIKNWTSL